MDHCGRASRRVLCHRGQNLRPFFTLVSEGKPLRRLLVISKGSLVVVEALHGTSPVSALCGPRILAYADLTPELSRAALRPWRWFNHSASAEAAKRARLERIVRPVPAVLLVKRLISPEPTADNCSS